MGIRIEGFISKPTYTRADRTLQFFFISPTAHREAETAKAHRG